MDCCEPYPHSWQVWDEDAEELTGQRNLTWQTSRNGRKRIQNGQKRFQNFQKLQKRPQSQKHSTGANRHRVPTFNGNRRESKSGLLAMGANRVRGQHDQKQKQVSIAFLLPIEGRCRPVTS